MKFLGLLYLRYVFKFFRVSVRTSGSFRKLRIETPPAQKRPETELYASLNNKSFFVLAQIFNFNKIA